MKNYIMKFSGHLHLTKYFILLLLIPLLTITSTTSAAVSQSQLKSVIYGTTFYDTELRGCSSNSSTLTGNDNPQKAFNYFIGKGLSAAASAGIVGNLMLESAGVNPRIIQGGGESDTLTPAIYGKGYGIAQWTSQGRQQNLIKFAQSQSKQEGDLQVQLDFLWKEATESYAKVIDNIRAALSPEDAATQWMGPGNNGTVRTGGFENPSSKAAHEDVRRNNARQIYNLYGQQTPGAAAAATNTINANCTGGDFLNGFIEYKQCNSKGVTVEWADSPYGESTICDAGCGPTAMAMIITNLTGNRVTPDQTATYGAANGTLEKNGLGGSKWNIAEVVGSHWGLKSQDLGTDITKINQILQTGGLVLSSGTGADPYTPAGHFIVIRAVTSDGKWLTGNSANFDSSKPYDPAQVIVNMRNAWGLTK